LQEGLVTEKGAKAGVFDDDLIQMVAAQVPYTFEPST